MLIVHFDCVGLESSDVFVKSDYVKNICDKLENDGYVDSLIVNKDLNGMVQQIPINEVDDDSYLYRFIHDERQGQKVVSSDNFELSFAFGTYNGILLLSVYIHSNSFSLGVDNNYVELLKLAIKDYVVHDWKKVEWLVDKDSECLSMALYPEIFRAENLARQLISEAMSKKYGPSWWDVYVPYKIRAKHQERQFGYKYSVSGFKNIDDTLFSVDIGDLLSIFTRQSRKWNPVYDETLNTMLNGMIEWRDGKVKEILEGQQDIENDLWETVFKNYLPDGSNGSADFRERLRVFDKNRNHVMHNKPLDRQAYDSIKQSALDIQRDLNTALSKLSNGVISEEERERLNEEAEEQLAEQQAAYEELREAEAGVEVRNKDEIAAIFDSAFFNLKNEVSDALRFRADLEVEINYDDMMKIIYRINNSEIVIKSELTIDPSEGASSEMVLMAEQHEDFNILLTYINAAIVYDEYQACFVPEINDVEPDIENAIESIVEYINMLFPNLREEVDSDMYRVMHNGGESPVYGDVACDECGEYYIAADDTYAPIGTCLNCGAENEVQECVRCGSHYIGYVKDDDVALCENCRDKIDRD